MGTKPLAKGACTLTTCVACFDLLYGYDKRMSQVTNQGEPQHAADGQTVVNEGAVTSPARLRLQQRSKMCKHVAAILDNLKCLPLTCS